MARGRCRARLFTRAPHLPSVDTWPGGGAAARGSAHVLHTCPPLMDPTSTMPAVSAGDSAKALASPRASMGMKT
eukprot:scaffold1572_cov97-Isochrysis_galbana.AAC.2